jgi:hypothetical protein
MCVHSPERAMYQLHCIFFIYSDYERWLFCVRLSVCIATKWLEWTFCMTKIRKCSVTPVSYYLRHIVIIYFSPHEVMFVMGCKTITLQAVHISYRTWGGEIKQYLYRPWGFQEVEAFRFQENRHMKVARLSALLTGWLYPIRKYSWYSLLLRGWVDPRVIVWPEGLCQCSELTYYG